MMNDEEPHIQIQILAEYYYKECHNVEQTRALLRDYFVDPDPDRNDGLPELYEEIDREIERNYSGFEQGELFTE